MMGPKISIIIPVYNVEPFLTQCLKSVINQTYDNCEIILVDDGSSDKSGKICDKFAAGRNNVKVLHQDNQGLSGARNSGVKISTGDYITFVDSDDIIINDCVESLVNALLDDADVVIAKMMKFYKKIPHNVQENSTPYKMTNEEAMKELCNQEKFGNSACAKLYKRYLVERFPYPVGKLYEDLATTHKIIGNAKGIYYISKHTYFYRQRKNSIMNHTGLTQKDFDALNAARKQYEYIKKFYPGAVYAAKGRCVVAAFDLLRLIRTGSKQDKKQFKIIQKYIKPFKKDVMSSNNTNKKSKIKCMAVCLGYYPAIWCSSLFEFMRYRVNK